MFSKACEYGIKAIVYIAYQSQKGQWVSLKGVAEAIDSPVAFTAKILQSLVKNDLIRSIKGAGGGYTLGEQQLENLTLYHVVVAIDGEQLFSKCGLGLRTCNAAKPCPVHFKFQTVRNELNKMLHLTTIHAMAEELEEHKTYLKV